VENFIKQFIQNVPELNQVMNEKLKNLSKFEEEELDSELPNKSDSKIQERSDDGADMDPAHEEFIDDLLTATENLRISDEAKQEPNPFYQYTTELQDLVTNSENEGLEVITSTSTPISIIGLNLVFRDLAYSNYLIQLFEDNFAIHSMALKYTIPSLRQKTYNYINEPTVRLFMTCVYGIGAIFATHPHKKQHEKYFIAMARDSLMSITCKCKVDIYIILSIYLLSKYELGQGNLHQSYLFNSMACSLTQHMGLHISYDDDFQNVNYAPKSSPLHSSILWSICLNDRIVTSLVQVPCVIHFKRIISPFYKITTNSENELHLSELCFAYLSRLWYIYDRYTDQIYSTNFDVGDTNNREKVLIMALKTLRELFNSLPIQLRIQSVDLTENYELKEQNFFILIFNFNYHVAVLQLNKIFIKENPNLTRKATVEAALKAASILSTINKNETGFPIDKLPYNFGYSIHSVALVLLFILTAGHTKNLSKLKTETNILELYQDSIEVLNKFATNWSSAELHLNHLQKLGEKYDLDKNYQTPTSDSSSPLSRSIQSTLEQINNDNMTNKPPMIISEETMNTTVDNPNIESSIPCQILDNQFPMFIGQQEPGSFPIYQQFPSQPIPQISVPESTSIPQQVPVQHQSIPHIPQVPFNPSINPQLPQNPPNLQNLSNQYTTSIPYIPPYPIQPYTQIYDPIYQYPGFPPQSNIQPQHQVPEHQIPQQQQQSQQQPQQQPQSQSQSQPDIYPNYNPGANSTDGSDIIPLDEEFINDSKFPEFPNINF